MSQGVHSGRFHFFAVGNAHLELLPVGPAWTRLVAIQHAAAARRGPGQCRNGGVASSRMRRRAQGPGPGAAAEASRLQRRKCRTGRGPQMPPDAVAHCLPPAIRAHVLRGGGIPEHRPVTVAFIRFEGTDALIEQRGAPAVGRCAASPAEHRRNRRRGAGRCVSRVRRRRRRRQADPDRRRAESDRQRRGAHAACAAQDRVERFADPGTDRRSSRRRFRRRHRPLLIAAPIQ